jgi:hypothetical protein
MAIRDWWIHQKPTNKNISNSVDLYTATSERPQNPGWHHVIDASGMPSKEEIRKALDELSENYIFNDDNINTVFNWLEKLAAD